MVGELIIDFFYSSMEMGQHISSNQVEVLLMDMSGLQMVMQMGKHMAWQMVIAMAMQMAMPVDASALMELPQRTLMAIFLKLRNLSVCERGN